MTDRELLELAAKVAGDIAGEYAEWVEFGTVCCGITRRDGSKRWNPLCDDGDALRLSVKLKLDVMFFEGFGEVIVESNDVSVRCSELYGADTMPATRRAIVRAAAEIGRRAP